MHSLLIDWLRKIHFKADTALATKRWQLAKTFAEKISRKELVELLRVFLFPAVSREVISALTQQLLEIDNEFPASDNTEEVRLLAGVVMVAAFEDRTFDADAFALGIMAAGFPQRSTPAQPAIVSEAAKYIATEADKWRPASFATDRAAILENLQALAGAEIEGETNKKTAENFADVLDENYGKKIQRLAEETGLLWWLLGEYSSALDRETTDLDEGAYALIAADEAASRTQLLPPPPSVHAILKRAIARCKRSKIRTVTLKEVVGAADAQWRGKFVAAHPASDCADLVPFVTALTKTDEAGDTDTLGKVLPKACPGVPVDFALMPSEAAIQFYKELMFLRALAALG